MTRTIGILVFPDFQLLDAAGPIAALEVASRLAGLPPAYAPLTISATGGAIRSSAGIAVSSIGFAEAPPLDTLIVAGGRGTRGPALDARHLAFAAQQATSCRRIASVCTGAFVLAAAGILDGRRATTHWRQATRLARLFPKVKVEPDRIWVRDGAVWTSAGISAGVDLALALVAADLGDALAREAARELVVFYRRPGGQSQFSALLELGRPDGRFDNLLAWTRARLGERLTVERLAEAAAMSPRNFARAFRSEIGVTPAKAVEQLRLEAARQRVEAGGEKIDTIAAATGFGEAERMRRAFIRAFGQPPQALRRAARTDAPVHGIPSAEGPGRGTVRVSL